MPVIIGTGSFLLFMSLTMNVVSLLVPYWYVVKSTGSLDKNYGLWGSCTCGWYYTSLGSAIDDNKIEDWFKSAQVLYALAVFLIVVSSTMVFIAACLRDNIYSKVAKAAGSLMIIAGVLGSIAIIVFGTKGSSDFGLSVSGNYRFDWGLWIGVAGIFFNIICAIFFLVQGFRR
ncbi:hypothetical protein LSH36_40g04000 [Paralvinella palmiformis]|uniref:Uncharacterized protein n=1 Tax=Paralvinella palmiformis TaxID=53620 RepID=A0AAD9K919_9ANNE|nr:hypothetical protein LSH36_40g04000 [Paralvinella palmiformis]